MQSLRLTIPLFLPSEYGSGTRRPLPLHQSGRFPHFRSGMPFLLCNPPRGRNARRADVPRTYRSSALLSLLQTDRIVDDQKRHTVDRAHRRADRFRIEDIRGTAAHDDAGDSCALCGADDCSDISRVLADPQVPSEAVSFRYITSSSV